MYLPLINLRFSELRMDPDGVVFLDKPVDIDGLREDGTVRLVLPQVLSSLWSIVVIVGCNEFVSKEDESSPELLHAVKNDNTSKTMQMIFHISPYKT